MAGAPAGTAQVTRKLVDEMAAVMGAGQRIPNRAFRQCFVGTCKLAIEV